MPRRRGRRGLRANDGRPVSVVDPVIHVRLSTYQRLRAYARRNGLFVGQLVSELLRVCLDILEEREAGRLADPPYNALQ